MPNNKFSPKTSKAISRRSLSTISTTNSVVSGTLVSDIASGLTGTIIVTAKDSSGNTITTGGELLMVRITNLWSYANSHYCSSNGVTTTLSSIVSDMMVDNGNGTYSYSYTITFVGKLFSII